MTQQHRVWETLNYGLSCFNLVAMAKCWSSMVCIHEQQLSCILEWTMVTPGYHPSFKAHRSCVIKVQAQVSLLPQSGKGGLLAGYAQQRWDAPMHNPSFQSKSR